MREFKFHPLRVDGSRCERGPLLFGAMGSDALTGAQKGRNGGGPVPTAKQPDQNSGDRIRIGLPYQNRIITVRVDRQKDVG